MPLPVQTFNSYLQNMIATLVNNTPNVTNLRPGSVAYALLQAVTGNSITLQQLIAHVYNIARLATSTDIDVDSYVADYGLARDAATFSSVHVQVTRLIIGVDVFIPVGAVVQTLSGIQFIVVADPTNINYQISQNAYLCTSSFATVDVTTVAAIAGTSGNVAAHTIVQIVSGVFGFNSVDNSAPGTGGSNQETDAALKARFTLYIQSLGKGTIAAIDAAIEGVQAGLTFTNNDQLYFTGLDWPGGFTIVVDDGTGAIPTPTLDAISAAIAPVKADGIGYAVLAPVNTPINVTATVVHHVGSNPVTVQAAVVAAITNYINTPGVGVNVVYAALATVIAGVPNVDSTTLLQVNGGVIDIPIDFKHLARANTITVTVI